MQAATENMDDSSSMLGLTTGLDFKSSEPVPRPSSTSTNGSLPQLPGISNLAAVNASNNSPPMRANNLSPSAQTTTGLPPGLSLPATTAPQGQQQQQQQQQAPVQMSHQPTHTPTPTAVSGNQASTVPVCQNCSTSTTPLWRRDEYGAVLCNACGLFLKLHGRPRPISLKTDVIKSRNRVKTMRPDLATKKKQQQQAQQAAAQQQAQAVNFGTTDPNGFDLNAQLGAVTPAQRQKANGHGDNNSPGSRGGTPSLYNPAMPGFHGLDDSHFQSGGLSGFSPNRPGSPLNGDRNLDSPQTHEQLIAANSALKTRVSELEVINELFRGRLGQLEHDEATARRGQEISGQAEASLRAQLEDSHRRENNMKRRLDELELELKAVKDATSFIETDRPYKRARLSEQPEDRDAESVAFAVEQAGDEDAAMMSATDGAAAAAVAAAAVNVADQAHHEAQAAREAHELQGLQDTQDMQEVQDPQVTQEAQEVQETHQAQEQEIPVDPATSKTDAEPVAEAPAEVTTADIVTAEETEAHAAAA